MKNIKDLTESFYLLTEQAGASSPLRDINTVKEAPWIKAIRGKRG